MTKSFHESLKSKDGNQLFFKKKKKSTRYIVEPNDNIITEKDDIETQIVVDTEYTNFLGNCRDITLNDLKNISSGYMFQRDVIKWHIDSKNQTGYFDNLVGGLVKNFTEEKISCVSSIKNQITTHISTQFKHPLYKDECIFFNPELENIIKKEVGSMNYLRNEVHFIDYWNRSGIESEIINYKHLSREEFLELKDDDGDDMPNLLISLYAFYMLADWYKIFEGNFRDDLIKATLEGRIKMDSRLSQGLLKTFNPQWVVKLNGQSYKVKMDLVDTGLVQGHISLDENFKNMSMSLDEKKSMDEYKTNMLLGLCLEPDLFVKYALNDLKLYDVYAKFDELLKGIYRDFGIEGGINESKLTVGANAVNLVRGVLKKMLDLEDTKDNDKILNDLLIEGTPDDIGKYETNVNSSKRIELKKKHTLPKAFGGRCHRNNIDFFPKDKNRLGMCDIDISSAYTSIISILKMNVGRPVIESFKENKVTLREFLNNKDLSERNWKLSMSGKLSFEQDLFISQPDLKLTRKNINDKYGSLIKVEEKVEIENTLVNIYSKDLINAQLIFDELDVAKNAWKKEQYDEFLDNVYVVSALYYPESHRCKNYEDFKKKCSEHDENSDGVYTTNNKHSFLETSEKNKSHYWFPLDFGKNIMDKIIQYRRKFKKSNPSLAYLFKLLGNTIYGVSVSPLFETSNVLFASNITGMCRSLMYCLEKGLNFFQSITDGGCFMINLVRYFYRDKKDASVLTRGYSYNERELNHKKLWVNKPISKDGKEIKYKVGKGFLLDGVLYEYDEKKSIKLDRKYELSIKKHGIDSKISINLKKKLDESLDGYNRYTKEIASLAMRHVENQFKGVSLLHNLFEKVKVNEDGIAIKDEKGDFVYEKTKGIIKLEIKDMCDQGVFHGAGNYTYRNNLDKYTSKMRGYEKRKLVTGVLNDKGSPIFCDDYYDIDKPVRHFLSAFYEDIKNLSMPTPYIKNCLLRPKEFVKYYDKTFQYTNLYPGETFFKLQTPCLYNMRHVFRTHKQFKTWKKRELALKNKTGGLGFTIYFMDDNGNTNMDEMNKKMDELIRGGMLDPNEYFRHHYNHKRDLRLIENKKLKNLIDDRIKLINTTKRTLRIMLVGVENYVLENKKRIVKGKIYLKDNVVEEENLDDFDGDLFYENNADKYSDDRDFRGLGF